MSAPSDPIRDPALVAAGYTTSAHVYDELVEPNLRGARRLVETLPEVVGGRLLDVGCGTGFATEAMLERFALTDLLGVDASPEMARRYGERFEGRVGGAARGVVGDAGRLDVPDGWADAAISTMALHWMPDRVRALAEMGRGVRPGGLVAVLCAGRGSDRELRDVLASLGAAVPADWLRAFDAVQIDVDELDADLAAAGLDALDVWSETRMRSADPDAYMDRMTAVAGHLSQGIPPERLEALAGAVRAAVRTAAGPDGAFRYRFSKLFAVATRPERAGLGKSATPRR